MKLIRVFNELINETLQLADKVYFKTGQLTNEDREKILKITNGDNYTKIITDIYFTLQKNSFKEINLKDLKIVYNELKNYNKNVFPIKDFNIINHSDPHSFYVTLENRRKIIEHIRTLPRVAIRNMKEDIRKERNYHEMTTYKDNMDYFMGFLDLLNNRPIEIRKKIIQKMFKNNTTLKELMDFTDDKSNYIGGVEFSRDMIQEIINEHEYDIDLIFEQNDVMILQVSSPTAIKAIGCNSLWCFTYGTAFQQAYRNWNEYSVNSIVYVIIDLKKPSDSSDFMFVLISPLFDGNGRFIKYTNENETDIPLFDMTNDNFHDPYYILKDLFGKNYKEIIKKYLNFDLI